MKTILFFTLSVLFGSSLLAQNTLELKEVTYYGSNSRATYIPPQTAEDQEHYFTTKLYVIGWSKDGKLAYVHFFPECCSHGEGSPPRVEVRIQDMALDKVLWSKDVYDEQENYDGGSTLSIPLKKHPDLQAKLKAYNITIQKWSGYFSGERYKDYTFTPTLTSSNAFRIQANLKAAGSKVIFKAQEDPLFSINNEEPGWVAGVINNPFEDRVAVIYYKESYIGHWEYITDFILVGCRLDSGFK
jgi:hypothetical protein